MSPNLFDLSRLEINKIISIEPGLYSLIFCIPLTQNED